MRLSIPSAASVCALALSMSLPPAARAQAAVPDAPPAIRTYKTVDGVELKAHVFGPPTRDSRPRPTLVFLHGGGWNVGIAGVGLRAGAALRGQGPDGDRHPVPAVRLQDDHAARRDGRHARRDPLDPGARAGAARRSAKVAVYGWSAGGHLGVSAVLFDDVRTDGVSAAPDALVLLSPAVSVSSSGYLRSLLLGRAENATISPADHVRAGMPPMIIFSGDQDVVTPNGAAGRFCAAVKGAGGRCELHVYPGVGHLLTRKLDRESQEMGPFDPDPATIADTVEKADAFLASLGYF